MNNPSEPQSTPPTRRRRGMVITVVVLIVLIAIGFLIGAISIAQGGPFVFPEERGAIELLPAVYSIL